MNPYFQEDCQELIRGYFGADETLMWAKECGYQDCFGYVVVSNKRVITAVFDPKAPLGGKRQRVTFYKPKAGLLGKLNAFQSERSTYLAPESALAKQELSKRKIYEAPLSKISGVTRQDYPVKLKNGETTMVEITLLVAEDVIIDRPLLYTQEDGDDLFSFMQAIVSADAPQTTEDSASLLVSLAQLHEAGVLSDAEFEAKKQALLAQK